MVNEAEQLRRITVILVTLLLAVGLLAEEVHDVRDTLKLYQGVVLKVDLANSIMAPALTKGKRQSYELSAAVDLKQRWFPTVEMGYARDRSTVTVDDVEQDYLSQGVFGRVGCDVSVLKMRDSSLVNNHLLLGVRIGLAGPQCDTWGEVHAGLQVEVCPRLVMGWSARAKFLFTRKAKFDCPYIPGYGKRKGAQFGLEYYVGVRI